MTLNYLLAFAILIVVFAIVRWQWTFISGFWQDGGRGQFLVMGMPAVIFVVLGAAALGLAAVNICLLYTSPSPRDRTRSRMPSSA